MLRQQPELEKRASRVHGTGHEWIGHVLRMDGRGRDQPRGEMGDGEGADAAAMTRSVPMAKALDDAMIVYAQNGERLRPEQGYPVRLFLPGYEGNMSVKWLRRTKVGDLPWQSRARRESSPVRCI